jgi:hypothetical protein
LAIDGALITGEGIIDVDSVRGAGAITLLLFEDVVVKILSLLANFDTLDDPVGLLLPYCC